MAFASSTSKTGHARVTVTSRASRVKNTTWSKNSKVSEFTKISATITSLKLSRVGSWGHRLLGNHSNLRHRARTLLISSMSHGLRILTRVQKLSLMSRECPALTLKSKLVALTNCSRSKCRGLGTTRIARSYSPGWIKRWVISRSKSQAKEHRLISQRVVLRSRIDTLIRIRLLRRKLRGSNLKKSI